MIIINFVVFLIFDPTREFHRNMPWGKAQNVAATASASGAKTLPPKAAGRKDCSSSPIGGWTKTQNVSECLRIQRISKFCFEDEGYERLFLIFFCLVIVKSCLSFLISHGQDGAVGSAWGEPAPAAATAATAATAARHCE
jgi:hypothetical protein